MILGLETILSRTTKSKEKYNESRVGGGLRYGHSSMQVGLH